MKQDKIEWRELNLSEAAEFINGRAFKPSEWERSGKLIIRIQDLTGSSDSPNYTNKTFENKYLVKKGDLLISWSATLDVFIWNREDGWLNQHIFKVNERKEIIDKKYLFYLVKTKIEEMKNNTHGSTMKHITKGNFERIKISLPFSNNKPDLAEQQRIVSILEKAEKLKERGKKAGDLLDEYLKSVFNEMFYEKGFEEVELGNKNVFEVQSGGTPSREKKEYWENGSVPWIGSTACKDLPVYQSEQFITKEGLENSSAKVFPKNTVLIALVGATIGKTGILMFNCSTNQNISGIIIKDKEKMDTSYLFFAIKQLYPQFMSLGEDAFKMATLSFIRSLKIPLPPLPLQQKFALVVDKVENMKENIKKINANAKELFNSLMQKAFRGEL